MKVSMENEVVIAANNVNENVFAGQLYEKAPADCLCTLLDTGSAAGLRAQLFVGSTAVTGRRPVNTQNRTPVTPDDEAVSGVEAFAGQQLSQRVENTTAAALTYRFKFYLEEGDVI
jgi:hypothetical protein